MLVSGGSGNWTAVGTEYAQACTYANYFRVKSD